MENSTEILHLYYYHHHHRGDSQTMIQIPQWMIDSHLYRKRLFLRVVEPIIVFLFGPAEAADDGGYHHRDDVDSTLSSKPSAHDSDGDFVGLVDASHRRLSLLPSWVANYTSHQNDGNESGLLRTTSMSFATLTMMYIIMLVTLLVFLSCFYHNQKTSPLFVSPRRHRLPKLVPPPLPVDGAFSWVKVCLLISDEEVRESLGYKMSVFHCESLFIERLPFEIFR
jgi:hypothetical protein